VAGRGRAQNVEHFLIETGEIPKEVEGHLRAVGYTSRRPRHREFNLKGIKSRERKSRGLMAICNGVVPSMQYSCP
jgi:hypothetical protein